jgi:hypothetical protein
MEKVPPPPPKRPVNLFMSQTHHLHESFGLESRYNSNPFPTIAWNAIQCWLLWIWQSRANKKHCCWPLLSEEVGCGGNFIFTSWKCPFRMSTQEQLPAWERLSSFFFFSVRQANVGIILKLKHSPFYHSQIFILFDAVPSEMLSAPLNNAVINREGNMFLNV